MKIQSLQAILTICLTIYTTLNGQTYIYTDARLESMANADITHSSAWNVFQNPSGLSNGNTAELNIGYRIPYQIQELSTQSFCGTFAIDKSTIGCGYTHSGSPLFNIQTGTTAFAHRLGAKIEGGVAVNIHSATVPDNIEKGYALSGDIGLTLYPRSNLNIGISVKNISGNGFNEYRHEEIERTYTTGVSYYTDNFKIATSLKMNDQNYSFLNIGAEVFLVESFAIRVGTAISDLVSIHAGAGYIHKLWLCDIAFSRHQYLGYTSNISIGFLIASK